MLCGSTALLMSAQAWPSSSEMLAGRVLTTTFPPVAGWTPVIANSAPCGATADGGCRSADRYGRHPATRRTSRRERHRNATRDSMAAVGASALRPPPGRRPGAPAARVVDSAGLRACEAGRRAAVEKARMKVRRHAAALNALEADGRPRRPDAQSCDLGSPPLTPPELIPPPPVLEGPARRDAVIDLR